MARYDDPLRCYDLVDLVVYVALFEMVIDGITFDAGYIDNITDEG